MAEPLLAERLVTKRRPSVHHAHGGGSFFDPEDGWVHVRRDLCRVDRRRRAAHVADLLRRVAVLDEHGSVRRVGPYAVALHSASNTVTSPDCTATRLKPGL